MPEIKDCTTNFFSELCGVNIIVDPNSQLGNDDDRVLIVGQSTGTAGPGTAHQVNDNTRQNLFGVNSSLNEMIDEFKAGCPTAEIWAFPVAPVGTAGIAVVTITGVPAAPTSGRVYLWVNGVSYVQAFNPAVDTDADLTARFAAAIEATDNSVNAVAAANVLTVTTVAVGEVDGFLDVRKQYGRQPDRITSNDITVAIAVTAPTGTPTDVSAIAGLAQGFEFVINPYTDDTSIAAVSDYLCGQWTGGSNGRAYGVRYGSVASNIAFGQSTNNALIAYMAQCDCALTRPATETASFGCLAYRQLNCQSGDVGASMTGMIMPDMLAPESGDAYTSADNAALVEAGMGYFNIDRINQVSIGRAVTTYTVADNGTLDVSLRDINKPAMIACISRRLREGITSKFTGYAFRRDGVIGGNSNRVMTLASLTNFMIGIAQGLSNDNLIQNIDGFVQSLQTSVDPASGCITVITNPTLVEQACCFNIVLRTN
jgi:phage tail sheath gpL-like